MLELGTENNVQQPPLPLPPVSSSRPTSTARPASDELNDLISSLGGSPSSTPVSTPTASSISRGSTAQRPFQPPVQQVHVADPFGGSIDDLMYSLGDSGSTTPVTTHPPPKPYIASSTPTSSQSVSGPAADNDLENLIASLGGGPVSTPIPQQRPSNISSGLPPISSTPSMVSTTPKGACGRCSKGILGQSISALGKMYHVECFVCGNCASPLGTSSFFQSADGAPTCANCHSALFCARCAHCDQAIAGNCISAVGKRYHVNCFICVQCLRPFGTAMFYERDSNPFCQSCFYGIFSSRCAACDQPIKADCVNACGKQWHSEHFVCTHCKRSFGSEPYFENAGLHYHQQQGSLCGCGCGRPVMGRVVQALGKQWLPEHFVCGFCMNPLAGQSFTERDGKAYCSACYGKLY